MEQRLDEVVTADGTALAYAAVGHGRPLVYVMGWLSHLRLSWELPAERALYEALAQGARLVRYDRAGCGLSAATGRPPSLASELEQLDAIAATLAEPFDLMGTSMGAPVAVAWAAAHPESVRRLVLYGGWARGEDLSPPPVRDHVLGLVESHWGLGSEVLTDIFAPDADHRTRTGAARCQRACSTAATARALLGLPVARRRADDLTRRQREVAELVSRGATNREIATQLGIEERSAEGHVERIRLRLGFRSRAQIAAWVSEQRTVG